MDTPTVLDLFAGAGGLAEGLAQAGLRVCVASEVHPQPALTHAFNHPGTRVVYGDIRETPTQVLKDHIRESTDRDTVDIVVGGPPCQGFSTAGKKVSSDPRNSLFEEFVRVVADLRPRMFLMENVPGFKKMHDGRAFKEAHRLFSQLGYALKDTILNAAEYGVPQQRKRFVMVGRLDTVSAFEFPEPTHSVRKEDNLSLFSDMMLPAAVTAGEALGDIDFLKPGWEARRHKKPPATGFQERRRNSCHHLFNHLATRHRDRAVRMFQYIPEGGTIASVPEEIRSAKRTMARLHRGRVSNAILALPDDLIHYDQDRIPTVREAARLQTFDDDYVFFGKRTSGFRERRVDVPQYTQVGNAVPPLLGRVLGTALVRALGSESEDLRDLSTRRRRHHWVTGSSAYAGYLLTPEAVGQILIFDPKGRTPSLPILDAPPVIECEPLVEWVSRRRTKHRQWAPGIFPMPVPAHQDTST